MTKRNEGFTLIEMLTVVGILGVMLLFVGSVMYSRGEWNGKKAAQKITEALSETRTNALAKTNAWMQIKYDPGTQHYILTTSYDKETDLGGGKDFSITFDAKQKGTTTVDTYDLTSFEGLVISYKRADGTFADAGSHITKYTDADGKEREMSEAQSGFENRVCTRISLWQGTEEAYVIRLYPESGKYTYERK
jgi:prepilin-type N-terminal cleavage/methylation domain-containing protein